jgi:hypothetical protein
MEEAYFAAQTSLIFSKSAEDDDRVYTSPISANTGIGFLFPGPIYVYRHSILPVNPTAFFYLDALSPTAALLQYRCC